MHRPAPRAVLLAAAALVGAPVGAPLPAVAVAASAGVPTATISRFDCARLRVEVTLDNSRSATRATYGYDTSFQRPERAPYGGTDRTRRVDVGPGDTRSVVIRVRDDARTVVTVHLPDGGHVVSAGTCGTPPAAAFGPADCGGLRLPVTLDNSRSGRPARYRWTLSDLAGPVRTATVEVDAGRVASVRVPLVSGSRSRVLVAVNGKGLVATSDWQACGGVIPDPRASFGAVDCGTVSVPVLLDNSRATSRTRIRLPGGVDIVLGPGQVRAFRLHLPIGTGLTATTPALGPEGPPMVLATTSTARCAETSPT